MVCKQCKRSHSTPPEEVGITNAHNTQGTATPWRTYPFQAARGVSSAARICKQNAKRASAEHTQLVSKAHAQQVSYTFRLAGFYYRAMPQPLCSRADELMHHQDRLPVLASSALVACCGLTSRQKKGILSSICHLTGALGHGLVLRGFLGSKLSCKNKTCTGVRQAAMADQQGGTLRNHRLKTPAARWSRLPGHAGGRQGTPLNPE